MGAVLRIAHFCVVVVVVVVSDCSLAVDSARY